MSKNWIKEGVTINKLKLSVNGTGPGCNSSTINPGLTEKSFDKLTYSKSKILKNLEAKIICPGTAGASQSNCTAAKVISKLQTKDSFDNDNPIIVGDTLTGGVCNGTYPVGNSTSSCTCSFSIEIIESNISKKMGR